jgi:hypothetical protein
MSLHAPQGWTRYAWQLPGTRFLAHHRALSPLPHPGGTGGVAEAQRDADRGADRHELRPRLQLVRVRVVDEHDGWNAENAAGQVHRGDERERQAQEGEAADHARARQRVERPHAEDRGDEGGDDGRVDRSVGREPRHALARSEEAVPVGTAEDDPNVQQGRHTRERPSGHKQAVTNLQEVFSLCAGRETLARP